MLCSDPSQIKKCDSLCILSLRRDPKDILVPLKLKYVKVLIVRVSYI